jgi:hypothetical protein
MVVRLRLFPSASRTHGQYDVHIALPLELLKHDDASGCVDVVIATVLLHNLPLYTYQVVLR